MKEQIANADFERFRTGAAQYAAYLETPEGRLRLDLAFANLQEFLPQATRSLHALDIGCAPAPPGRLGFHVTLLDALQLEISVHVRRFKECVLNSAAAKQSSLSSPRSSSEHPRSDYTHLKRAD